LRDRTDLGDVRDGNGAREAAAGAAAADRRHSCEHRDLEVVGGGMLPRLGARDQILDRRRSLDELRLRRAAAPHRDDDDVAVACEEAREVNRDRRLPDALTGADHGDRRQLERLQLWRVEPEVGADVRESGGECPRSPIEPLERAEHGLVGKIDHDLGGPEAVHERHAGVATIALAPLLRPADEDRPLPLVRERLERVAHHRRIVLTVDERDRADHRLAVTSLSIRPVYFSYSPVEVSNWMIRSWPWNGYRRHTVTCDPSISTTL